MIHILNPFRITFNFPGIALILVSLLFSACEPQQAARRDKEPEVTLTDVAGGESSRTVSAQETTQVCSEPLRLWKDFSGSASDAVLRRAAQSIVAAVRANRSQMCGVEIVRFSVADKLDSEQMPEQFFWGQVPKEEEFVPDFSDAKPEVKLFQDARKKFVDQQHETFKTKQAGRRAEYEKRFSAEIARFLNALLEVPEIEAPCTRFFSLARRISSEEISRNLTITDGWNDCHEEQATIPELAFSGKHAVILISRKVDTQGDTPAVELRRHFLQHLFPGAEILDSYEGAKAVNYLFAVP